MTQIVKASVQVGDKTVVFEGPRDFVAEQIARFTEVVGAVTPKRISSQVAPGRGNRRRRAAIARSSAPNSGSCIGRILAIRGDGFFAAQRTISEVRTELATRGWHYPLTALSGRLQTLVQQRQLRREKVKEGRKKIWRYSNV